MCIIYFCDKFLWSDHIDVNVYENTYMQGWLYICHLSIKARYFQITLFNMWFEFNILFDLINTNFVVIN